MTSTTSPRYVSVADTAKEVRKALKAEFPGVKFSVKCRSYAGGASIDLYWTDGPTTAQVDAVAQLFCGATFDGMTDCKHYHATIVANADASLEVVHYGANFIFGHRSFSDDLMNRAARELAESLQVVWDDTQTQPWPRERLGTQFWTVCEAVRDLAYRMPA